MRDNMVALAGVIAFCLASGVAMALNCEVTAWSLMCGAYFCLGCHVTLFRIGCRDGSSRPGDALGRGGGRRCGVEDIEWR